MNSEHFQNLKSLFSVLFCQKNGSLKLVYHCERADIGWLVPNQKHALKSAPFENDEINELVFAHFGEQL